MRASLDATGTLPFVVLAMMFSSTKAIWIFAALSWTAKAWITSQFANVRTQRARWELLALSTPTESELSVDENEALVETRREMNVTASSKLSHGLDIEMNGDAKVEEPGDKDRILRAILAFQASISRNDPRFPLETIVQRTLDTVEDIFLHLRRVPFDYGWVIEQPIEKRPTIVVLGSGWAAHALLKVADTYKLRIIVVSPSNHFVFTPMLASASVGTVEYRSMTEAVRAANPMIENYIEGQAVDIDIEKQVLSVKLNNLLQGLREGEAPQVSIPYDKLIVAVGCKVADSLVKGASEHSLRLKTCDDARRLRNAVGEAFEFASRPDVKDDPNLSNAARAQRQTERQRRVTFAIVGGGPTGVELAGELTDFFRDITRPRKGAYPQLRDDVRIVLIHGGGELVPQFDEDLRRHALASLRDSGVEVRLLTKVTEVGDGFLKLMAKEDNAIEETLLTGLNVWAAGTEPVKFVQLLLSKLPDSARGAQGKIMVDPWLRSPMPNNAQFGSILVMGDAAVFLDRDDALLPQTAQVAGQQGAYVARMLDRDYDLSVTPPKLQTESRMMRVWMKSRGLEEAQGCTFSPILVS
jgi:NADH dehydrogenase FAD-containing subunit